MHALLHTQTGIVLTRLQDNIKESELLSLSCCVVHGCV